MTHGHLFTNEACWKRSLTQSGDCGNYVGELETTLHAVRDCLEASEVWTALLP